jgi:hypothetical protein
MSFCLLRVNPDNQLVNTTHLLRKREAELQESASEYDDVLLKVRTYHWGF